LGAIQSLESCHFWSAMNFGILYLFLTNVEFREVRAEMQGVPYKAAVGCLMYAMVAARPDLAFPVSVVNQHMSKYGPMHWAAVKRVMRYLQGTHGLELQLGGAEY